MLFGPCEFLFFLPIFVFSITNAKKKTMEVRKKKDARVRKSANENINFSLKQFLFFFFSNGLECSVNLFLQFLHVEFQSLQSLFILLQSLHHTELPLLAHAGHGVDQARWDVIIASIGDHPHTRPVSPARTIHPIEEMILCCVCFFFSFFLLSFLLDTLHHYTHHTYTHTTQQNNTQTLTALAADMAEDFPRASMTLVPLFCTSGMNSSRNFSSPANTWVTLN